MDFGFNVYQQLNIVKYLPRSNIVSCLLFVSFMALFSQTASAKIYTWVDENGKVQYSDRKPAANNEVKRMELGPINQSDAVKVPEAKNDSFVQQDELEQQEQEKLRLEAKTWASKECVWRWQWNDPVKGEDGEVTGYKRKRIKVCRSPIPSKYRRILSDYTYNQALYNGQ